MAVHREKIESVLRLDARARFDYFIRRIADSEVVWGLFDTGWATASADGRIAIPVWPEQDFAAICADAQWACFHPEAIPLDAFLTRWLPGMAKDRRLCSVFPVPAGRGHLVSPPDLLASIRSESSQYE
ncbi:hypothetical protein GQ56_0126975 [Burkholderia paludis]|uniref:DUF2750 domain-containing protein n=1 Tax=Burkholderia paludis TaxID=1506587 RepID=UPI0004DB4C9D|nr:DUF2750 domain-containing protein [Burkholderia paludis]KFG94264.1 hypothetical protein GQ56_0126975 [Burkholderia paludis]